jgi:aminoglycoside phosphotransferase (APT) family kinase protein
VDDRLLRRWVDDRLQLVRQVNTPGVPLLRAHKGIDRLSAELYSSLKGKKVAVSWIHGDYFPGNILTKPDGSEVLGIVDWDLAAEDLPMIDIMHLLLSTRILLTRRELGDIVSGLMEGSDQWTEAELALLQSAQEKLPGESVELRSLLLLAWLRHISSNLTKAAHYATQWLWVTKNIETVLGIL